ncbi:MAG: hypothetical protein ACRDZO_21320 [Egibacteraceae bacterium]
MSTLLRKVNSSSELAGVPLHATEARQVGELAPVLATPAAFGAGLAAGVGVTGAFAGGFAVGDAVGD